MKRQKFKWWLSISLFCCLLLSTTISAQQSCAVQAGQDATYCLDDLTFDLGGDFTGDLVDIEWSGPANFTILTPNSQNTTVTYAAPPVDADTYEFYFGGFCEGVWEQDTVVIELVEVQTPVISWQGMPEDGPISVCHSVTLTGTDPISNEAAEWLVLESYNITVWSAVSTNNNTEFTFSADEDDNTSHCSYFTIVYALDNNGCRRYDTISVEFLRTADPIEIAEPDEGDAFCGDTIRFLGSGLGCAATGQFTFIETPNGIDPDLISEGHSGYWRSVYDFNPSGTGFYTIVYTVNATAPCASGTDTVRFFVCVTDLSFGDTRTTHLFCGGLPTTGTIPNTNPALDAGCDPQPWESVPGAPDVTISGNTFTINNPDITEVIFDQYMECQECDLPGGGTVNCFPKHRHVISTGPQIDLSADTILMSCGGTTQFLPYSNVSIDGNGASYGHGYEVIFSDVAPPCAQIGDSGGPGNFENLSCEGTYTFRIRTSATGQNNVTCLDSVDFTVIVQTLDPPCAGVQSDICLGDTVCLDGCSPSGPADIHWEQIDGNPPVDWLTSQDIEDPKFVPLATGTYQFEYSFSRDEDCYLADTLTFTVDSCGGCDITPRAWLQWIRCSFDEDCNEVYSFEVRVFDQFGCHDVDEIVASLGNATVTNVIPLGSVLVIQGVLNGATPQTLVCLEISFTNTAKDCPTFCPVRVCFNTPECGCRMTNLVTSNIPDCITPQHSYCITVDFDYCGPEGPMNILNGFSTSPGITVATFYNNATFNNTVFEGHNEWTICFSFAGPCADELVFEYIGQMENSRCSIRDRIEMRCCCEELPWSFREIDCFYVQGGGTGYNYTLVIEDAQDCGPFSVTTNGNEPSLWGHNYVNGDLIITGSVTGLGAPGELCVTVDFENEDCCDIRACTRLPCCCQKSPLVDIQEINCVIDENGDPTYEFTIRVGNPNGWAVPYDLTVDCGDVTSNFTPEGNFIIVTGTITNVSAEPGDDCCFNFDFANCNLCDIRRCVELPPCECVDDVTVVYPPCITPGEEFCVTYNFNYYGPPTTGVYSWWYVATNTSDPGWSMTSPGDMESVPISLGANSVEVCLIYEGECLEDGIDLVVRGDMYTSEGGLCCIIRDPQELKCCCDCTIDIEYCEDPEMIMKMVKEISKREKRSPGDEKLIEWSRKFLERREPCDKEPCCPICQPDDYQGLVWVEIDCPNGIPDGLTYEWNTGHTGPQIIGTYPNTYSVTVYDAFNDCLYEVTEEIICDEKGGDGKGGGKGDGRKLIKDINDVNQNEQLIQPTAKLNVSPNPVDHTLMIQHNNMEGNNLFLFNQFGEIIYQQKVMNGSSIAVDVSQFPEGVYYGILQSEQGVQVATEKVIVMH